MILQRIVFPKLNREEATDLYFHSSTSVNSSQAGVGIPAGETVSFDTYFNLFFAQKWAKYTTVSQLEVQVQISGAGIVSLIGENQKVIEKREFSSEQDIRFELKLPMEDSFFYLSVEAKESSYLRAAWIETKNQAAEIHLALVTCTYNREEDIKKNLDSIRRENQMLPGENPVLDWIYVVDNARTLKREEIEDSMVSLFPNPNTGGAGGFTRGMKEAVERTKATHIILMDDDVEIEFEAFVRNKALLAFLKEEYQNNFIGGAMLRMDKPYIMHAAGENWNNGWIQNPYKNTDMRTLEQVIRTAQEINPEQAYAAWWYCCIPRKNIIEKGYPLPLFLHGDDAEYGLRNGKPPIYLNGIAVWHEEFEDKRASVLEYYDTRNALIVNVLYVDVCGCWKAIGVLFKRFFANVFRYRYSDIDLILLATEDFTKGSQWLNKNFGEEYHKKLLRYGYRMDSAKSVETKETGRKLSNMKIIIRYILPAFGITTISVGATVGEYAGKRKVYLIDKKRREGFVVEKSWEKTLSYFQKIIVCCLSLLLNYSKIKIMWKNGVY